MNQQLPKIYEQPGKQPLAFQKVQYNVMDSSRGVERKNHSETGPGPGILLLLVQKVAGWLLTGQ